MVAIAIREKPSEADLVAAAELLGFHPTHRLGFGSMFCDACATNVTGPMGMDRCPKALPPAGTVITGRIVPPPPPITKRTGGLRTWSIAGANGKVWDVEERIATRGTYAGKPYLYCPCPAWKFHGQSCKHTDVARQEM